MKKPDSSRPLRPRKPVARKPSNGDIPGRPLRRDPDAEGSRKADRPRRDEGGKPSRKKTEGPRRDENRGGSEGPRGDSKRRQEGEVRGGGRDRNSDSRASRSAPRGAGADQPFRTDRAQGRDDRPAKTDRPKRSLPKGFGEKAASSPKPARGAAFRDGDGKHPRKNSFPGNGGPRRDGDARGGYKNREDDRRDGPRRESTSRDERPRRDEHPRKSFPHGDGKEKTPTPPPAAPGTAMTLNKYLAHAGPASRRAAAAVIKEGKVQVNGETLTTPGYRVQPGDRVTFEGKPMKPEAKKVYLLLNKPKGFITTTEDEHDRRTVMELVQSAEAGRLFPVGRLDRNTTGLLLLTNDGDLAQRLTHPKYEAKKVYQVGLNKPMDPEDFKKLATEGVVLEDGPAKPDVLSYLDSQADLGLEIHNGRNRIVRRMFEALGYEVEKLDRVMFAGLTKKNLPRGQWRHLTEQEIVRLKHFKP